MDLLSNLSDDQLALLGCGFALFVSAGLMYFSFFLGPMRNQEQSNEQETLKLNDDGNPTEQSESNRKAA